jgi:hypothetical protein
MPTVIPRENRFQSQELENECSGMLATGLLNPSVWLQNRSNFAKHLTESHQQMGPIDDIMSALHVPKKGGQKITLEISHLCWGKKQWSDLRNFCSMQFYQAMSLRNVKPSHPALDSHDSHQHSVSSHACKIAQI